MQGMTAGESTLERVGLDSAPEYRGLPAFMIRVGP